MEWKQWYTNLKRSNKKVWTNYLSYNNPDNEGITIKNNDGYATVIKEADKNVMYFVAASKEGFADLVKLYLIMHIAKKMIYFLYLRQQV